MLSSLLQEKSRREVLKEELAADYFQRIDLFLKNCKKEGKTVYPESDFFFAALEATPFDQVAVVLLGQDPYHGAGEAHGLSFSVPQGVKIPPSLRNISKELLSDLGASLPSGDLSGWAKQGVLLLNRSLSVEKDLPHSHQHIGWERFTDAIIRELSERKDGLVFLLRGKSAQEKIALIDQKKHHILCSSHPSPFSAHRGFFGSQPFSQTNAFLRTAGKREIDRLAL